MRFLDKKICDSNGTEKSESSQDSEFLSSKNLEKFINIFSINKNTRTRNNISLSEMNILPLYISNLRKYHHDLKCGHNLWKTFTKVI